jgi:hypothetical protein
MTHGTEQHLEDAEHAQHAAHDPFDRRVAMSMAIVAAVLAGVTMVSHRGHNETLRLQTEANIFHTQASDQWNFFQAKNIRSNEFQAFLMTTQFTAAQPGGEAEQARREARKYWINQVDKYEGAGFWEAMAQNHFDAKKTKEALKKARGSREKGGKEDGELAELSAEARDLTEKAREKEHESHRVHRSVNWLDFGHLGLELALVLCSVALLSKQRSFWQVGIAVAVVGAVLALYGVYGLNLAAH